MKKSIFLSPVYMIILFGGVETNVQAQCQHNPTILGGTTLLCPPDELDTVSTQTYDAYQWYRRVFVLDTAWTIIPGATNKQLPIDFFNYAGMEIRVAATLNGCTEYSPLQLIDGYAFSLPSMWIQFENNGYEQIGDFEFNVCNGNTVTFEAASPYINKVQWFNNGIELTEYAGKTSISPTLSGNYIFNSCTIACPDFCQPEDTPGPFPVKINFGNWNFCTTSILNPNEINFSVYPNPSNEYLYVKDLDILQQHDYSVYDIQGSKVISSRFLHGSGLIDVSDLAPGTYLLVIGNGSSIKSKKFVKK